MTAMSNAVSSRTYRGAKARNYERNRTGQRRWRLETEAVADWLPRRGGTVLDVPCGTGRFLPLYADFGLHVTGVDISEEMLAVARNKLTNLSAAQRRRIHLEQESILGDEWFHEHDCVVCVRLLHLVSQRECGRILERLCSTARSRVILTVRLAEKYVENPSSTTMPDKWFRGRVRALGWRVAEERRLSSAGWTIMRLEREDR